MDKNRLSDSLTVSGQVTPADMPAIAAAGFGSVVCNRPDGEAEGQPSAAEVALAAWENGLEFHYMPIFPGDFSEEKVAAFRALRRRSDKPVFAYCRTGSRCATLNALANPERMTADELIEAGEDAGYDLCGLRPRIAAG
jgi:sulfide:quinone oxidoreductase